jgi:HK97 family phage major capsid protein
MDKIAQLRARRTAGLDAMQAVLAAATAENRDLTTEESAKYEGLKAADDKTAQELDVLEDLERRKAAAAKPVAALPGATPALGVPAQPKAEGEKGLKFARMFRALAAANGVAYIAAQIAEKEWGESGLFANQNVGTGSAGGFLVEESVAGEIIELLRPASVVMSLSPIVMPMPAGNMTMNRQASGASANYIGEQQPVPATNVAFGQVKLSAKKLGALIPISNDLLRTASVQADRVVRDDLVAALAQRTDLAFIRGAGTEFSPKGLRFQTLGTAFATTHVLTQTGSTLANVTTDLGRLELALTGNDVPMTRAGWIMAPRTEMFLKNLRDGNGNIAFPEMATGTLRGFPYRKTTQIPVNLGGGTNESELYLADFAHVVVGEHMGIEVAMSTEAAYIDANATMQAAFSRDETVMRAIAQHDIGVRHLPAIAVLTGVTWTP